MNLAYGIIHQQAIAAKQLEPEMHCVLQDLKKSNVVLQLMKNNRFSIHQSAQWMACYVTDTFYQSNLLPETHTLDRHSRGLTFSSSFSNKIWQNWKITNLS
ncbi:hypothetical protein CDAR_286411 [Caerostris darwini]|uniref:Uncharacterized protein n=1 Tax=Caerostris darwini TaxID=1538125 RepID=A0AAV4W0Z7_9ARAC|nr:hypothetical protein CDAR_286411 [Caerostris darwini]